MQTAQKAATYILNHAKQATHAFQVWGVFGGEYPMPPYATSTPPTLMAGMLTAGIWPGWYVW